MSKPIESKVLLGCAELAYVFIDSEVFHDKALPELRALHVLWVVLLLGLLLSRRRH